MNRMTAEDFDQELLDLYDGYAHGQITKREFLDRAGKYAIGGLGAAAILSMLSPNYALAEQVSFNDPAIYAEYITYPSPNGNGDVRGYLVRPAGEPQKYGAVVVAHENRGLNPYIEDVARRVAKAGYLALAPDGLSSLGGYPGNDEEGRAMQSQVDPTKLMNDFLAAVGLLLGHEMSTGKVGIVGFCYGGGVCNAAAVAYPELACAVPFYGVQPKVGIDKIQAALMLHYAALDTRITGGWPDFKAALDAAGKTYEAYVYEGVNHGFHNDTTPRYDKAAAELAWSRTLGWFEKYLA
jgi:carboxymethylenebutenolidase